MWVVSWRKTGSLVSRVYRYRVLTGLRWTYWRRRSTTDLSFSDTSWVLRSLSLIIRDLLPDTSCVSLSIILFLLVSYMKGFRLSRDGPRHSSLRQGSSSWLRYESGCPPLTLGEGGRLTEDTRPCTHLSVWIRGDYVYGRPCRWQRWPSTRSTRSVERLDLTLITDTEVTVVPETSFRVLVSHLRESEKHSVTPRQRCFIDICLIILLGDREWNMLSVEVYLISELHYILWYLMIFFCIHFEKSCNQILLQNTDFGVFVFTVFVCLL